MKKNFAILFIAITVLFASCKKSNDSDGNSEYFYHANIDGVQHKIDIPKNNTNFDLEAGSSLGGLDVVLLSANITNYGTNGTTMVISKGMMSNYTSATEANFRAFFAPGAYSFRSAANDNGMSVNWYDGTGGYWSSEEGDQSGSSIRIVSIEDMPDGFGTLYIKTKVEFTCKLYDGLGNMKVASGTFVGLFGFI